MHAAAGWTAAADLVEEVRLAGLEVAVVVVQGHAALVREHHPHLGRRRRHNTDRWRLVGPLPACLPACVEGGGWGN